MGNSVTDDMVDSAKAVSLWQVLHDCGIEMRFDDSQAQQFRCPLHGDGVDASGGGSARIYPDSNQAKCWGCGKTYDTIEWVSGFHRLNFVEAVEFLCREYTSLEVNDGQVSSKEVEGKEITKLFEGDFRRWFPQMTGKERVALSQTLDGLWAVGCSVNSQKKVEEVFDRIMGRKRDDN